MNSRFFIPMLALVMLSVSCKKSADGPKGIDNSTPRTNVPTAMQGQWLSGTFSMSEWWSYDGTQYEGNPYERSVAFNLSPNGDAEFYLAVATYNGACRTEGFTYQKGTVAFNEAAHSFTFYPQQGNYRGLYSCTPGSNFDRDALASELHAVTYYYSFETDELGKEWMLIRFSADETEFPSYFQETNW